MPPPQIATTPTGVLCRCRPRLPCLQWRILPSSWPATSDSPSISTELPVSTSIRQTSKLGISRMMTRGSSWGHSIPSKSFLEKDKSGNSGRAPLLLHICPSRSSRISPSPSAPRDNVDPSGNVRRSVRGSRPVPIKGPCCAPYVG
ncbi:hypothetical protein LIER_35793 [Lithospermum erythrorhizon]|uniref:Uncharacterized protein n=1 Tax=Lithospermum erythrorhizon TaxID=34254 RepID=A0AAV3P0G2_LITER